jgi:hypothetical protein
MLKQKKQKSKKQHPLKRKLYLLYFLVLVVVLGLGFKNISETTRYAKNKLWESAKSEETAQQQTNTDAQIEVGQETSSGGSILRSNDECTNGRIFVGTLCKCIGDKVYVSSPGVIMPQSVGSNLIGDAPLPQSDSNKWRMWYGGMDGASWRIYHANSEDALTWHKKNNTIPEDSAFTGTDGRIPRSPIPYMDSTHVHDPWVLKERMVTCSGEIETTKFKMWYSGYINDSAELAAWRIFRADSDDGFTWTKQRLNLDISDLNGEYDWWDPTNPKRGDNRKKISGCVDVVHVREPSVVLDINKICIKRPPCCVEANRTYHMWYAGEDGHPSCKEASRIYYASSPSGNWLSWVKAGVVLDIGKKGDGDDIYVADPSVILEKTYNSTVCGDYCEEKDRTYHMWYAGYGGMGSPEKVAWRIFYATSKDGISWTKKGMVLDIGAMGDGDFIDVTGPMVVSEKYPPKEKTPPYRMWYAGNNGSTWIIYEAKSQDGTSWEKVDNSFPVTGSQN